MTAPAKLNRSHHQWRDLYAVESDSNPNKFYTIGHNSNGTWACDCPAWVYHTPRKACKHIKRVQDWLNGTMTITRADNIDPRVAALQTRAEQAFDTNGGRAKFIELD